MDFGDFGCSSRTSAEVVPSDAAQPDACWPASMADLCLTDQAPSGHLILTHAHLDHVVGAGRASVRAPRSLPSAWFPAEAGALRTGTSRSSNFTEPAPAGLRREQTDRPDQRADVRCIGDTEICG